MQIVNMTPHDVVIIREHGDDIVFRSQGVIRLKEHRKSKAIISGKFSDGVNQDDIRVNSISFSLPSEFPEIKKGTFYIVSRLVADAVKRDDFIVPDEIERYSDGKIKGCKAFSL